METRPTKRQDETELVLIKDSRPDLGGYCCDGSHRSGCWFFKIEDSRTVAIVEIIES